MISFELSGKIVDVVNGKIYPAILEAAGGRISAIRPAESVRDVYLLPGLVDAHIHIESSMLAPSQFAKAAARHGTTATVSDPHEIANVLGVQGVEFMIEDGARVPFKFFFGAPPCVPATGFETSGASISPQDIAGLFSRFKLKYLSEMMNYPGVVYGDSEVLEKIRIARELGKPIDGHAPGLSGELLEKYAAAGIATDHECSTIEEAREKIRLGMKILLREGSAAKNFEALWPLLNESPESCMLCSDDLHPDDLLNGHVNLLLRRAVAKGVAPLAAIRAATLNPIKHYGLNCGLLQVGDPADFIVVDNLKDFNVAETYVCGNLVARKGESYIEAAKPPAVNKFFAREKRPADFELPANGSPARVIRAVDGEIVTGSELAEYHGSQDARVDLLKLAVINRYEDVPPSLGLVRGFGLKRGALAGSVAHDSHNIIVVGVDDDSMAAAANAVISTKGGLAFADGDDVKSLPLPIAGIMSDGSAAEVAESYRELNELAKTAGCALKAPFMTLSFMALLVIPKLKLSDRGLFDGEKFEFTGLFVES